MSKILMRPARATKMSMLIGAVVGIIAGTLVTTSALAARTDTGEPANPDLQASCGTDVVVILDESGSIDSFNAQGDVADALTAFVAGLQGTNSRMRVVEFSTNARNANIGDDTGFQLVDADYAADVSTYLTTGVSSGHVSQNADSYRPWSSSSNGNQAFTNWEAALAAAAAPGSPVTGGVGAPLVVFLTDGNPNTIGTNGNSNAGAAGATTAADAAIGEMAALQNNGGHVVSLAVGDAVTANTPFQRLLNLTEPHVDADHPTVWSGTGPLNLRTTDAMRISDFSAIDDAVRNIVFGLCAPSLSLQKIDQDGNDVTGWSFTTTVESLSGGSDLEWISPDDGTATAPTNKTRSTNSAGTALFQWTPGSVLDPEPWSSDASFSETLANGWTVDPRTYAADNGNCTVDRLETTGTVSTFAVDIVKLSPAGDPEPGDTVRYDFARDGAPFDLGKGDIVACTVQNRAPSSITIAKNATPLSAPDGTDFSFTTASGSDVAVPLPAAFDLDVDADDTLPNSETFVVTAGTFTVAETPQDYWDLTSIQCTDQVGAVTAVPDLDNGSVEITMPAGASITCTFDNVQRPQPALEVTKTASPLEFQERDGSITYTVVVSNPNGNDNPVTIASISDAQQLNQGPTSNVDLSSADPAANAIGDVVANDCGTLISQTVGAADLTCEFTVSYTGANAGDVFDDVVSVVGLDRFGTPVGDNDEASALVTPAAPQIVVDKQNVQPITVVAPGGPAIYSITVTNPANAIEDITLTTVTDQLQVDDVDFGDPLAITVLDGRIITATTCGDLVGTVLVPGASYSCEFTVDLLQVDPPTTFVGGETVRNLVTVTAQDDDPTPQVVEGTDEAERDIAAVDPEISVFKTDLGAQITEPGSNITYFIDVNNLSPAESVTIDRITDEIWFNGSATAEGLVTIEDSPAGGAIEIVTSLPGPQGVTLVSTTCDALINTSLAPSAGVDAEGVPTNESARATCEITLQLPANAGDLYSDQVRVAGTDTSGDPVSAENSADTPAVGQDPAVSLVKSPDFPTDDVTVPETGGDVTFSFIVTNTSPATTDPITITDLTDSVFGDLLDASNPAVAANTCVNLAGTTLANGESTGCQLVATLSGTVSAPHTNTATVTVTDDEGVEVGAEDDGAVGFSNVLPTITVDKTADPLVVSEYGEDVTFSVVVTNTSAEDVTITSLEDSIYGNLADLDGSTCALGATLAANGGTYSCDFTQFVAQDQQAAPAPHVNVVAAIAVDDEGFEADDDDPATVTFTTTPPTVGITKTDFGASVDEDGGPVTYTITIENTSPEPVTITSLTDTITYANPVSVIGPIDLLAPTAPVTSSTCRAAQLAAADGEPGGADELTCSFVVELSGTSQIVTDVVNVIVTDNDGETGGSDANDNTPINDVVPEVEVVKYANGEDDSTRIAPGDAVVYRFDIFNRSTVEDVLLISLVDDRFGDLTVPCGLDAATWLTPDDGDDTAGTDQTTCELELTPTTSPAGLASYDHVNVVTVTAADDEIIASQDSEDPAPFVTDDDDALVEMRRSATLNAVKVASTTDIPFEFQLDGGDGQTTTPVDGLYPTLTWDALDAGTYDLTELVPTGWELGSVDCTGHDGSTLALASGIRVPLDWGDDATCTFDNIKLGDVAVDKTITAGPTQQPGTDLYDVTYRIVVTNESFRSEQFDLTDSLGLTDEITVVSIGTITSDPAIGIDPTWDGQANDQLTDGPQTIAASDEISGDSTVTVTIPVTVRVPAGTSTQSLTCQDGLPADDGGSLNAVTISSPTTGQEPTSAQACENFGGPAISFAKSVVGGAATYDPATGEWNVRYDVVVENDGDGSGEYDLTDQLRFGSGVEIVAVDAELFESSGQTAPEAPGDGVFNGAFDGIDDTLVIAGADIVAGASHTYRISVTATVETAIVGAAACQDDGVTAGGFLNVADVAGATTTSPSACAPFATLELVKVVDSGDGGNAEPTDFVLTATGVGSDRSMVSGAGSAIGAVPAGSYVLTETELDGYGLLSIDCDGVEITADADGNYVVTVDGGADVSCVFTNDDAVVDLEILKSDDDATVVAGGSPFDYTITVTNGGRRAVDSGEPVTVVDELPAGLSWVSFPGNCVQADQRLTCDLDPADLGVGDSVVIVATARADAGIAGGTYTNFVSVTTDDDPVCEPVGDCTPPPCGSGSNNVACEDTTVTEPTLDVSGFTDVCVADAPYFAYDIVTIGIDPSPFSATLTIMDVGDVPVDYNGDGVVDDDDRVVVSSRTGALLWPGAKTDAQGNAVDWPGWIFENGQWLQDPSDEVYRQGLRVQVDVNPTAIATVTYPPQTSGCADPEPVVMPPPDPGVILPETGSTIASTLRIALVILLGGLVLLVADRRRRTSAAEVVAPSES